MTFDHQRTVVVHSDVTYFGARVDNDSLVTGEGAVLGATRFSEEQAG
jgi:hypothetical protein